MNEYATLQVANTRFAIGCSHPPFAGWLAERCSGFLSQEEPHLWLSLSLDSLPAPRRGRGEAVPLWYLSVRDAGDGSRGHGLELSMVYSNLSGIFWPILQLCLLFALAAKQPPDLLLHAAGIVRQGAAYLFVGPSGAGKSTVCKLSANSSASVILHDDAVALSETEGSFFAWSTPLCGEIPAKSNVGAPLRAIFSLKQDETNYVTKLSGWQVMNLLVAHVQLPIGFRNGEITSERAESLKALLELAGNVPCYELHFRPDDGFWQCIERPPSSEAGAGIGRGERW